MHQALCIWQVIRPSQDPVVWERVLFPFNRGENGSSESLRNLFKVTQLVGTGQSWDLGSDPSASTQLLPEVRAVSLMPQGLVSEHLF